VNYSACLRHLVGYLSQKDDSDRKALLAVLRNMAFHKHQDLGRPIDDATIGREMKDAFRKLLLQELGTTTTKEDIDTLYQAIENDEIKWREDELLTRLTFIARILRPDTQANRHLCIDLPQRIRN
jgi:hypothetical protein